MTGGRTEPVAASVNAACKLWYVTSGEFTQDPDSEHWGAFWEPLQVDLPESAKPSCCLRNSIVFYDHSGNRVLCDYVRHYGFMGPHPNLLFVYGKWREVVNGRVEYRNGGWFMRWGVSTNTKYSIMANAGWKAGRP